MDVHMLRVDPVIAIFLYLYPSSARQSLLQIIPVSFITAPKTIKTSIFANGELPRVVCFALVASFARTEACLDKQLTVVLQTVVSEVSIYTDHFAQVCRADGVVLANKGALSSTKVI